MEFYYFLVFGGEYSKFAWMGVCLRTIFTEDSGPEQKTGFYSSRYIIHFHLFLKIIRHKKG